MDYKNSQILAAVVSEWARPAISQIAAGNLMHLPMLQSLHIEPMIQPVVNALVTPMLAKYFGNIPEESIPQMAHDVVEQLRYKGPLSILEGVITFDEVDLDELADLLQKNLPVEKTQGYQVKH